ncbi:hypothetical protein [Nostoc sp.]
MFLGGSMVWGDWLRHWGEGAIARMHLPKVKLNQVLQVTFILQKLC